MKKKGKKVSLSNVKRTNKWTNKLQKQGKLKNKIKGKFGGPKKIKTEKSRKAAESFGKLTHELEEKENEIGKLYAGYKAYSENKRKVDEKITLHPNKKKKTTENEVLESYEKYPRKFTAYNDSLYKKSLLPIKSKSGIIPQFSYANPENEASVEYVDADSMNEQNLDTIPSTSENIIQSYMRKEERLLELKEKIAGFASTYLENPEENIEKLLDMQRLLHDEKYKDLITGQKLIILSQLEMFKDTIPGYKMRLPTEKESTQKVGKDVKNLRKYEETFLQNYQKYLQSLDIFLQSLKQKNKKKNRNSNQSVLKIEKVALQCICELLVTHPHFNFRNNIIASVVPLMAHTNNEVSDMCCSTVKLLFKEDKLGEVSLEAVKQMVSLIKRRNFKVHPKVLNNFLALKFKHIDINNIDNNNKIEQQKLKLKEKQLMSKKMLKRNKKMKRLESVLLETEAQESTKKRETFQTNLLKQMFSVYFRILKSSPKSVSLTSVLEGLAKFSHLINIEFFSDLIKVLYELLESKKMNFKQNLNCMIVVFTIMAKQGEVLNIDLLQFYTHLYQSLLHLHAGVTSEDVPIALECLDIMIHKRRKQITVHRLLAFIKRLSTLALQVSHNSCLAFLNLIRIFFQNHKGADILLDTDKALSSGIYLPELEEPEYCNANASTLWELILLQRHYHPLVQKFAKPVASETLSNNEIPSEILKRSCQDLFDEYHPGFCDFNPPIANHIPSKKKKGNPTSLWFKSLHASSNF